MPTGTNREPEPARAAGRPLAQLNLQIGEAMRPFFYRPDSTGDRGVIEQIFREGDYQLSKFALGDSLLRLYRGAVTSGGTPLIVDAGANIGASVVYFAGNFPKSRIVAIEPERNNCEMLRTNCSGLNFELLEGGIGAVAGESFLNDPGRGDWSFRLDAHGEYPVPVFAAAAIVAAALARGDVPFIFKIDIEGGEADLFREDTAWVSAFPLLIIELHDWRFPGTANSRNFLRVIASFNFDVVLRGENVFCFNNDLLRTVPG
jgi:FkbM family methyltransferase